MRLPFGVLLALLSASAQDIAKAAPRPSVTHALSIGSPNVGRLDGGTRLTEAPYLRVVPFYVESNARWGLPSLVGLIDRAAKRVAQHFPDAVLSVGDLSRKGGGELGRHRSHESGRDADVGFYVRSAAKKPILPERFVPFRPDGRAGGMPGVLFDEARNWAFVEAVIDDPSSRVSHLFVAAHIRAKLLRYAEQTKVPVSLRERAAEVMMEPRHAPHDDHFHVRIACPRGQRTCIEDAVVHSARSRPPTTRERRRAGSRGLPQLPEGGLAASIGAGVANLAPRLRDFPPPPTIRSESGDDEAELAEGWELANARARTGGEREPPRPLANAAAADNVER